MEEHGQGRRYSDTWDWPLQNTDGFINVINEPNRFEADLEVPSFRSNEIDIKVMNDQLVLHCFQERGGGRTPREIHRNYMLPDDVDPKTVKSTLREDGILQITASKKRK